MSNAAREAVLEAHCHELKLPRVMTISYASQVVLATALYTSFP